MSFKHQLAQRFLNILGWHTNRHIVVFESDDWGAIRMPSLEVLHKLKSKGVKISDVYGYDHIDTLASNDDLELLMDVLSTVKDKNNNPAKITLNTCVCNPDFNRIKESNYQKYYYEPFPETLKRYPHHDRSFTLWKEGIERRLFQPQFHGREHLNASMWMQYLREGDISVRAACDEGVYSLDVNSRKDPRKKFLAAFNILYKDEYGFAINSIKEGLGIFEQLFGFRPSSMIAPSYTWDKEIEDAAYQEGVRFIQGGHMQIASVYAKSKGIRSKRHYTGQKNKNGQVYLVRTCCFEPSQNPNMSADSCMKEISVDFKMHKPAIVSCHRLNFIGDLNSSNRDGNLREFKRLLQMIVAKYPDVEFMSSDELGLLIC